MKKMLITLISHRTKRKKKGGGRIERIPLSMLLVVRVDWPAQGDGGGNSPVIRTCHFGFAFLQLTQKIVLYISFPEVLDLLGF